MDIQTDKAYWDSVPSVDAPAAPGVAKRRKATRRVTLRAVGVLGGALALNVLSWLPPNRGKPAHAKVGTEYNNCDDADYEYDGVICVDAPYSSGYCGGDGWFLQYSGTCFVSGAVSTCGPPGAQKNAWRWPHGGTTYRCADGQQQWCGGHGFFICSHPNP